MTSQEIDPSRKQAPLDQQETIKLEPAIKQEMFEQDPVIKQEMFEQKPGLKQEICTCCADSGKVKTELLVKSEGVSCDICKRECLDQKVGQDLTDSAVSQSGSNLLGTDTPMVPEETNQCESPSLHAGRDGGANSSIPKPDYARFCKFPLTCTKCEFSCKTKRDLAKHMDHVHAGKRPNRMFCCSQCNYKCDNISVLTVHINNDIHFSCSKCQFSFKNKRDLTKHIMTSHSGGRPFSCSQCQYRFKYKSNLTRHIKTVHS